MGQALDIGATLKLGWETFTREAVALIVGFVLYVLVLSISMGICAGPMILGYNRMCLRAARGEHVEIGDVFKGFDAFGPSFILAILIGIIVAIGSVLCVLPGIVAGFLLCWAFWFMADGDLDPMSCMRRSSEFAKLNVGPLLVFLIVASIVSSLGGVIGGVGSLVTGPIAMMMMAHGHVRAFGGGGVEQPALGV